MRHSRKRAGTRARCAYILRVSGCRRIWTQTGVASDRFEELGRRADQSALTLRRFALATERKPDTFRRGSASGSGDRPGLQNRWRAMRVVLGGFDSHALPPQPAKWN